MVDVVSIVVAVLALLGTIAQAVVTAWFNHHSEEKKRQISLRSTFSKYHDPLHLAADDLSLKLITIIPSSPSDTVTPMPSVAWQGPSLVQRGTYEGQQGAAYQDWEIAVPLNDRYSETHTCFVFAQFFAWVYILRRDTEFLRPHTTLGSAGAEVIQLLARIRAALRSPSRRFLIVTGIQSAMGEISTVMVQESQDGKGQLRCIGYAAFCDRWTKDPVFRSWFHPIVEGVRDGTSEEKLVILQHLLTDLLNILDPEHIHTTAAGYSPKILRSCTCKMCASAKSRIPLSQYHTQRRSDIKV
ncbi:hypothetical protein GYMLUDRAFT_48704 [Collybiopsis luxurians FD-317 M1]|uniref:Uncharacterized protein n=1 Tax=Collybiopsis luxurians FD-317 M1 TaxID=944289 RepID=A0A0D0BXN1_9AGAR|nr:hypothetical protein GYMLUDRAFT_48704 [Collybiopsis luxurians FD-317 M1]